MAAYPARALDPYRPWARPVGLTPESALSTAASLFAEALAQDGASPNTVSAFEADLRLFSEAVGGDRPISQIGPAQIEQFRAFLRDDRGVPCSPASLRRRLTAVQSLFRHLVSEGLIKDNPVLSVSAETAPDRPQSGDLLSEEEAEALVQAASIEADRGDWRPLLLVELLLGTGISKAECLSLLVSDVDPEAATLAVGSGDRRRLLSLDDGVAEHYRRYAESLRREGKLFDCTGRNLEYVLSRLGRAAGLSRNPSFRVLRATAAARLQRAGANNADVAERLGISRHTWPALRRRIRRASSQ